MKDMYCVITQACIGTKDKVCTEVCPCDCIYEGDDQFFIHPDECIDCGACIPACPVDAIYHREDTPEKFVGFIRKAHDFFGM
jgi:NAD-dependent dihydropyrimidine dehydrogenase PreA subunit